MSAIWGMILFTLYLGEKKLNKRAYRNDRYQVYC